MRTLTRTLKRAYTTGAIHLRQGEVLGLLDVVLCFDAYTIPQHEIQHEDRALKEKTADATREHRVEVKGKYLKAIEEYVSTVDLGDNLLYPLPPEFDRLADSIIKLHGRFLNEEIATAIVFRETFLFSGENKDRSGALSDPANADLHDSLVLRLKNYLESLPRRYIVRIELPSFPYYGTDIFQLTDDVSFVSGRGVFAPVSEGPQSGLGSAFARFRESTCIEFKISGYAEAHSESPSVAKCISLAKQTAFVMTNLGICKSLPQQKLANATLTTEATGVEQSLALPHSLARCLGALLPNEERLLVFDQAGAQTVLASGKSRAPNNNEEKLQALGELLSDLGRYFRARGHSDYPSISAAIEWYQDSLFAENQTYAYLAACIGLEALLGSDGYLDNMSKRLADRYAFLLGKGRTEREQMVDSYTEVLKVRGKLVHAKAATLDSEGRQLLRKAQDMLLKAIWHELQAMYRALGRPTQV